MATVLFLGGGPPSGHGYDIMTRAVHEAHARGLRVHLTDHRATLDASPDLVGSADEVSELDFLSPEACVGFARRTGPDLVLSPREYAQSSVAAVVDALGLPGNTAEVVTRIRTKDACREWLRAAGFTQPEVAVCRSGDEARDVLARTAGPWVVKPRDAMGSLGVSLVRRPDEVGAAVAALPGDGPFLVERFVSGDEYSVEGVFVAGEPHIAAVTRKALVGPGSFIEVGHVLPAPLAGDDLRRISEEVRGALGALSLRFGVFHVELWWTPSGPVLGEVHGRPGGDWIHRLLAHAIPGFDLYGAVYDDFLGRAEPPAAPARAAAVRFLVPPAGRVASIEGFDEVAEHPDVLHASCDVTVGQQVRPPQDSFDRGGVVVVGGDTAEAAERLAVDLAASVRFG